MILDPYPPQSAVCFTNIHRQIWQSLDPSPLQNTDVLNGWSLKQNYLTIKGKGVARKTPIDLLQCSLVQWVYEAKS